MAQTIKLIVYNRTGDYLIIIYGSKEYTSIQIRALKVKIFYYFLSI